MISSSHRPLPDNTHNTHNRQTSMPPVGFELTVSAGERPQTYAIRPRGHRDRQNNNNNIYLTAIGLSPGGSGFKHIYKYLTLLLKFTFTSGLHEKHVVTSCIFWNHLSSCFQETGKPRKKTCIEVVGHRTLRTLTSSHSNMYISTKHITR